MSGPTSVAGSSPSPSFNAPARSATRRASSSWTFSCTSTRLAAVQRCPVVPNAAHTMASVARARSASSITRIAFLPPISSETRLPSFPARSLIDSPTSVEPVNEITEIPGCSTIGWPTLEPLPNTRLSTPAGSPASSKIFVKCQAISGVSPAGLNTAVLPATSAGISFQLGIANGKFQGVITPATPIGERTDIAHLSGISLGVVTPYMRRPSPAAR